METNQRELFEMNQLLYFKYRIWYVNRKYLWNYYFFDCPTCWMNRTQYFSNIEQKNIFELYVTDL